MSIKAKGLEIQYEISDEDNTIVLTVDLERESICIIGDGFDINDSFINADIGESKSVSNLLVAATELGERILGGRRHWENVTENFKSVTKTEVEISAVCPKSAELHIKHGTDGESNDSSNTPYSHACRENLSL